MCFQRIGIFIAPENTCLLNQKKYRYGKED